MAKNREAFSERLIYSPRLALQRAVMIARAIIYKFYIIILMFKCQAPTCAHD